MFRIRDFNTESCLLVPQLVPHTVLFQRKPAEKRYDMYILRILYGVEFRIQNTPIYRKSCIKNERNFQADLDFSFFKRLYESMSGVESGGGHRKAEENKRNRWYCKMALYIIQ